jgi:hypothetical protein
MPDQVSMLYAGSLDMIVNASLSFSITPHGAPELDLRAVTPVVNNILFSALVTEFEREEQFDLCGGYGGLIPDLANYGPLDRYFLAEFEAGSYFAKYGAIYLLGCGHCSEVGCWPITCKIKLACDTITWHEFKQPHRPDRSYWRFGPFVFDSGQYKKAVAGLCADLARR